MFFPVITNQERLLPFYITGIGTQPNQEDIDRIKGFPDYQWFYCSKGKGVFHAGKKEIIIQPLTGFYLVSDYPHSYYAVEEPWETNWITFSGTCLPFLYHTLAFGSFGTFKLESSMKKFNTITKALASEDVNKVTNTSALLYSLLIDTKNALQYTSVLKSIPNSDKLEPVINYISNHFQEDISLDTLSQTINISSYYLCKLFKSEFGLTPVQYLTKFRLQTAKKMLIDKPQMKINKIAQSIGYRDTSYFCSIFKKQESISPTSFRALHGI